MKTSQTPVEFVTLWSAHSRRVYAYIYSLIANWSDADDIFQETTLVLMQKFDEFEPGTSFFAWACRVAYHKVLVHLKNRRFHEHIDEPLLEVLHDRAQALSEFETVRLSALSDCLNQLPKKDRQLIELRYHGSNSVESVAVAVGRSAWTVYKALGRIHEALLNCMRRKILESERA
jgi:RNA polymerase sigma-70 factor (ECF subfamily)